MDAIEKAVSAKRVTINIPVPNAAEASRLLCSLLSAQVLVSDGTRYALLDIEGTRVAFVAEAEDITEGRPALAVELEDGTARTALDNAVRAQGLVPQYGRHSASRFVVARLPGAADLIYYTPK